MIFKFRVLFEHSPWHIIPIIEFLVQTLLHDEENQIRGFSYVFDCTGLTLAHLSIWTPAECSRVLSICDKNLPMRHKDINLVNLPFPMWAVFEFCKTLLSDKIRRRFSVINSIEKLKTKMGTGEVLTALEQKFIPLSYAFRHFTLWVWRPAQAGADDQVLGWGSQWTQRYAARYEMAWKHNSCIYSIYFLSELDSMIIEETSLTKKTKQKKSSLWNIFSNYGSQASAESL